MSEVKYPFEDQMGKMVEIYVEFNNKFFRLRGKVVNISGNTVYIENENNCLEIVGFNYIRLMREYNTDQLVRE